MKLWEGFCYYGDSRGEVDVFGVSKWVSGWEVLWFDFL